MCRRSEAASRMTLQRYRLSIIILLLLLHSQPGIPSHARLYRAASVALSPFVPPSSPVCFPRIRRPASLAFPFLSRLHEVLSIQAGPLPRPLINLSSADSAAGPTTRRRIEDTNFAPRDPLATSPLRVNPTANAPTPAYIAATVPPAPTSCRVRSVYVDALVIQTRTRNI